VDYFLFDTKSKLHGGSGKKFDWRVLDEYDLNKPFFLSGGITLEDAETIRHLDYKYLYGVDINSKFEIVPGTKDINQVKQFIQKIKN
jgi:phosphoribosylanthranilate isomerase